MVYKVTDPYGATYSPWSKAVPHRGADYALDENTPLLIDGTQIGLVGQTGAANGPHVHVQAGRDEWAQQTIDPRPFTWKGGTVVKSGEASEWGKYVCVRVGDVNVFYCHLNRIDVKQGQVIGGDEVIPDANYLNALFYAFRGRNANQEEIDKYVGKWTFKDMIETLNVGPERAATAHQLEVGRIADRDMWQQQIELCVKANKALHDQLIAVQAGDPVDEEAVNKAVKEAQEALDAVSKLRK
jgi:hypothetical protein